MKYLLFSVILLLPIVAFAQSNMLVDQVKSHLTNKQYNKANGLISLGLKEAKTDASVNKEALWYYKGKLLSQMYFEKANTEDVQMEDYLINSYMLLGAIAAFQNACLGADQTYRDMSYRQLGGLHRFLKRVALEYFEKGDAERSYLNFRWARNCDKFVGKYLTDNVDYEMDTMLIYLTIYTGELTNRNNESKYLYEELSLCGVTEEEMFIHNFMMLAGLKKTKEAASLLKQGLHKYPRSNQLVMYMLHWLSTNEQYQEAITFVDEHLDKMPDQQAKLYFIKGIAWNRLYDKAMATHQRDATLYFKNSEEAYRKALDISPSSFDYAYNLAALYYNKALMLEANQKETLTKQSGEYALMIQRAEKTLETTMLLKASDTKVIGALEDIYRRTNQTEKLLKLRK